MQKKSEKIAREGERSGLILNKEKTQIIKINTEREMGMYIGDQEIENVQKFHYLASILGKGEGIEEEVKARINKAQNAFYMLRNVRGQNELTLAAKTRIFNTNVNSILLYSSKTWKVENERVQKIQVFVNK